jgi:hypothetical protein
MSYKISVIEIRESALEVTKRSYKAIAAFISSNDVPV